MKKLHTPNHKLYDQYYVNQAKQKGGSLPAFHGARFQHGYGLGSIFRGLFHWAMPHLQQGAKVIAKKALQTGVNVVQDVLDGDNIKKKPLSPKRNGSSTTLSVTSRTVVRSNFMFREAEMSIWTWHVLSYLLKPRSQKQMEPP